MKRSFLIIIIIILFLAGYSVFGQEPKSVVRLTNGVKLKGRIIEYVENDYMIMHIMGGQDLRIPFEYILSYKIRQRAIPDGVRIRRFKLPQPGYFNYTSGGILFYKQNSFDKTQVKPLAHMVNGYRINKLYRAGIGFGLDNYGPTSAVPMYLSIRKDFFVSRITPQINLNLGYGWMWENDSFDDWYEYDRVEGGYYLEVGTGFKVHLMDVALIINYSFKQQHSVLTQTSTAWWTVTNTRIENHRFRNMVITVGVEF